MESPLGVELTTCGCRISLYSLLSLSGLKALKKMPVGPISEGGACASILYQALPPSRARLRRLDFRQ